MQMIGARQSARVKDKPSENAYACVDLRIPVLNLRVVKRVAGARANHTPNGLDWTLPMRSSSPSFIRP